MRNVGILLQRWYGPAFLFGERKCAVDSPDGLKEHCIANVQLVDTVICIDDVAWLLIIDIGLDLKRGR